MDDAPPARYSQAKVKPDTHIHYSVILRPSKDRATDTPIHEGDVWMYSCKSCGSTRRFSSEEMSDLVSTSAPVHCVRCKSLMRRIGAAARVDPHCFVFQAMRHGEDFLADEFDRRQIDEFMPTGKPSFHCRDFLDWLDVHGALYASGSPIPVILRDFFIDHGKDCTVLDGAAWFAADRSCRSSRRITFTPAEAPSWAKRLRSRPNSSELAQSSRRKLIRTHQLPVKSGDNKISPVRIEHADLHDGPLDPLPSIEVSDLDHRISTFTAKFSSQVELIGAKIAALGTRAASISVNITGHDPTDIHWLDCHGRQSNRLNLHPVLFHYSHLFEALCEEALMLSVASLAYQSHHVDAALSRVLADILPGTTRIWLSDIEQRLRAGFPDVLSRHFYPSAIEPGFAMSCGCPDLHMLKAYTITAMNKSPRVVQCNHCQRPLVPADETALNAALPGYKNRSLQPTVSKVRRA